ncbi:MAG TPA: nitroreductase family deazaflavin-dependent oxidoreductase [Ktedonobacteraceae bacterium]|nr:nitroreductase family deazaflavin-dependent oxidoreductase [Ktedonobacteraceae bacterium]
MFRDRIRIFNKYVTNRVFRGFASRSQGPFAVIRHVGRRSGKPYETTIMVWHTGEGFVIALTYGSKVDWYRNIVAAEGGTLLWHGKVYTIGKPEPIDAKKALTAFPAFFRFILRRSGTHEFVWVKSSVPEPARA